MSSSMTEKTILIVEDEENLRETLKYRFNAEGYRVVTASDGRQALDLVASARPDLVMLDVMLPGLDGFEVCRILRKTTRVPILMLTARDEEVDKVVGLEMGADDYVTKPFSPRELAARVRTVLRRVGETAEATEEDAHFGPLTVSFRRHEALIDEHPVALTPSEFLILAALVREPGRAFTRQQLLERALGHNSDTLERNVDVHVMNIRRKLGFGADDPIKAVYGVGYKFEMSKKDG